MTNLPPPTSPYLNELRHLRDRIDIAIAQELARLRKVAIAQAEQHRAHPRHRPTRGPRP